MSRASGRSRMRLRKARKRVPEKLRWVDAAPSTAMEALPGAVVGSVPEAGSTAVLPDAGHWEDVGNRQQRRVLAALQRRGAAGGGV